jgi:TPP-dependent pyruvate/acetoin dehydrogenase alpha subunit
MIRSRNVEEMLLRLYREGQVSGPLHLSIGQEAVAVGVIGAMRMDDLLLPTHRGHCHALAKGLTAREIVAEVLGRATGCCGGRGGSMHLSDPDKGLLLTTSITATNVPIAAGIGYALNYLGQDRVVVPFIGDGATNNGDFHEGLNLASIWGAPLLLVIENNLYAISVSIKKSTKIESLAARAQSYVIRGHTVDGMNVFKVYEKAQELIEKIRAEKSPAVLEAMTYRFVGHFAGDVLQSYRSKEEVAEWKKRDPLVLAKNELVSEGVLTEKEAARIEDEARNEAQEAGEFALSSPYPELEDMYG